IRAIAGRTGGKVDVVAHSLGSLSARAAAKWWPDAAGLVDDMVLVAGMHHGNIHDLWLCATPCMPSAWQSRPGSRFLGALNAGDETPGAVSYTSVYSLTDLAVPELPGPPTSELAGASNIAIQRLCPARFVDHPQVVSDAATFAVAMDALAHPGPADPARVDRSVCLQGVAPGVELGRALAYELTWYRDLVVRGQEQTTDREPPLAPWAVP
ncbi:MAG: lipase, partial [Actinomycetota bacterium]